MRFDDFDVEISKDLYERPAKKDMKEKTLYIYYQLNKIGFVYMDKGILYSRSFPEKFIDKSWEAKINTLSLNDNDINRLKSAANHSSRSLPSYYALKKEFKEDLKLRLEYNETALSKQQCADYENKANELFAQIEKLKDDMVYSRPPQAEYQKKMALLCNLWECARIALAVPTEENQQEYLANLGALSDLSRTAKKELDSKGMLRGALMAFVGVSLLVLMLTCPPVAGFFVGLVAFVGIASAVMQGVLGAQFGLMALGGAYMAYSDPKHHVSSAASAFAEETRPRLSSS